jgi:hypothetical protein
MAVASNIKIASKYFRTNDGVRLHYLQAGAGKPLVLGSVGIQDSHPGLVVIQASDGPIRFD